MKQEVLRQVMAGLKGQAGIFEVAHKTTFLCTRHTKLGDEEGIVVDILDYGPEAGDRRYSCEARPEDENDDRLATGNPEGSIEMTLATVHWNELDR